MTKKLLSPPNEMNERKKTETVTVIASVQQANSDVVRNLHDRAICAMLGLRSVTAAIEPLGSFYSLWPFGGCYLSVSSIGLPRHVFTTN